MQLFVKSHIISQETIAINNAVSWTQNLSEVFISENGNFSKVKKYFSSETNVYTDFLSDSECILLLYDNNWQSINSNQNPAYIIFSYPTADSKFNYEDIYILKCSDEFSDYLIQLCFYNNGPVSLDDFVFDYISKQYCINHCQVKKYCGKNV